MFKKVGRVDVKILEPKDQESILEVALENEMVDFEIVESDEGEQVLKVCKYIFRIHSWWPEFMLHSCFVLLSASLNWQKPSLVIPPPNYKNAKLFTLPKTLPNR